MTALLELSGVTAFYGASQALFGIDLSLNEGEAVALMGRNHNDQDHLSHDGTS